MGSIATTYDLPNDLTIVTAAGRMQPADFQEWNAIYYKGRVTSLILWDLRPADLSEIQTEDLKQDAIHTGNMAAVRKNGKTAIVSGDALAYGLSRMLETFYELENIPFAMEVFRDIEEAHKWLGVPIKSGHDD